MKVLLIYTKLRIRGNSVRLRLTQSEIAQFRKNGSVEETVEFGFAMEQMIYALVTDAESEKINATVENNLLSVFVPKSVAEKWTNSEQIGIEALQLIEDQKHLRILIKKDFACLEKRTGEDDSDAFPHPLEDREC